MTSSSLIVMPSVGLRGNWVLFGAGNALQEGTAVGVPSWMMWRNSLWMLVKMIIGAHGAGLG
ncbi:hypothetical protein, partial [Desulfatitalea alkaliphila]